MSKQTSPIHQRLAGAIDQGSPPTVADLKQLRRHSEQQVKAFKISIWVAIGIINLLIWVPLPFNLPPGVLIVTGVLCVGYVFSIPIVMIRRHLRCLEALKLASRGPKRRLASSAGQRYLDQVKDQGRTFVQAELELLEDNRPTES